MYVWPSMDLHPSREMVASGQRAGRNRKTQAHIRIWSTETLQTLYVFGMGEFEVGVAAVAFSQLVCTAYLSKSNPHQPEWHSTIALVYCPCAACGIFVLQ